tara:strand:- start:204 stop:995 length:792 start_codon:yes stop_codon:yes gene_type:complete
MLSLEKIPTLFAVLSAASLIAGVVFDIGYFSNVGFEYVYYLNIQDHIESAIIWAPTLIFTAFGIYFSGFSDSVHGRVEVLILKKFGKVQRVVASLIQKIPMAIGAFSLVLAGAISTAAYGSQDFGVVIVMAVILVTFLVLRWWLPQLGIGMMVPRIPTYAAAFLVVGSFLFYLGSYWGEKDLEKAKLNPSEIVLLKGKRTLGIVRPISQGIVVFDTKSGRASMLRFETIVSISTPKVELPIQASSPFDFHAFFQSFVKSRNQE